MPTLSQQLFRRKGVTSYVEGADSGEDNLARTLGLLPLMMLGIGGTVIDRGSCRGLVGIPQYLPR